MKLAFMELPTVTHNILYSMFFFPQDFFLPVFSLPLIDLVGAATALVSCKRSSSLPLSITGGLLAIAQPKGTGML